MNDLAEHLRASVDGVPAVTVDEIVLRSGTRRPDHHGRHVLVAAAIAVIALVGVGLAVIHRGPDRSTVQVRGPVATSSTSLPPTACAPGQAVQECPVSIEQASSLLGFDAPTPSRLPSGWAIDVRAVVDYPALTPDNPLDHDLLLLKQIWQRQGTDRADASAEWASLEVRRAVRGDPATAANARLLFTLADGTEITGTSGLATVGADPATSPAVMVTDLAWVRNGRSYHFTAHGLSEAQASDLVSSLSS